MYPEQGRANGITDSAAPRAKVLEARSGNGQVVNVKIETLSLRCAEC